MNLLFLHQNYPGQFKLIASELAHRSEHKIVGVGARTRDPGDQSIEYRGYSSLTGPPEFHYPPAQDFGDHVRRGRSAADVLTDLRDDGFKPDVVIAHPGWGDALFVPEIFPRARFVAYMEYFYRGHDSDIDFDPEFPPAPSDVRFTRLRNASNMLAFTDAACAITPTNWQASLFPQAVQSKLDVMHDGIDTKVAALDPGATCELPNGKPLRAGDEVVTYVSRSLEPYRGFHVFMRALPDLLRARPKLQVVIVGRDRPSYGRRAVGGQLWRQFMLDELGDQLDLNRVHFTGTVSYSRFIQLLSVSTVHIYLTYPFVLSWSLIEAMACGCSIVGSDTGPVREVITDRESGRLVGFFDRRALVETTCELLDDPAARKRLGAAARETAITRYDFRTQILPRYTKLLEGLAAA